MSYYQNNLGNSNSRSNKSENIITNKYYNNTDNIYGRDIDYAYDYNGNWFQPSRWWNSLWYHNRNIYDRRDMYDRRDGLKIENRYNFIQNQPSIQPNHDSHHNSHQSIQALKESNLDQQQNVKPRLNDLHTPPKIELVKPQSGSLFPFPTLSSSSNIMPEEIAMSPMAKMHVENSIHSISAFTDNLPLQTANYNFDYKGPDYKNHKPLPVDMMASESIYHQPNTVANEIIKPKIAMEYPNPM